MDELIYRFLLQAGYPRAAIVDDLSLFALSGAPDGGDGPAMAAFALVDPDTADRLALIDAVGALDADALRAAGGRLGRHAQRFGGRAVQGFLVRIDPAGTDTDEQVQFYRVWPNEHLQRVSVKTFPDLAALRTRQLLVERRELGVPKVDVPPRGADGAALAGESPRADASSGTGRGDGSSRPWVWLPGTVLALLALADAVIRLRLGADPVSVPQAVLLVGAAALLLAPAFLGSGRR